jgi:hypothetical protein
MPDARENLVHAHGRLQHNVRCAVNIHAGNIVHLDSQYDTVSRHLEMVNEVSVLDLIDCCA